MARSMSLRGQRSFIIGRNGAQADIVVADGSVSRQHAVIINSSTATFIQDLDSAHGTYYDEGGRTMHVPQLGKRLEPMGEPTKLVEGSTLRFGTHAGLVLRIVGLEQQKVTKWQPPAWVSPPERSCHLEVRSNHVANPYLEHLAGGDVDERISLRGPSTSVGRSAAHVDIVIADESISRQHAAIVHDTERPDLFDRPRKCGRQLCRWRALPSRAAGHAQGRLGALVWRRAGNVHVPRCERAGAAAAREGWGSGSVDFPFAADAPPWAPVTAVTSCLIKIKRCECCPIKRTSHNNYSRPHRRRSRSVAGVATRSPRIPAFVP